MKQTKERKVWGAGGGEEGLPPGPRQTLPHQVTGCRPWRVSDSGRLHFGTLAGPGHQDGSRSRKLRAKEGRDLRTRPSLGCRRNQGCFRTRGLRAPVTVAQPIVRASVPFRLRWKLRGRSRRGSAGLGEDRTSGPR